MVGAKKIERGEEDKQREKDMFKGQSSSSPAIEEQNRHVIPYPSWGNKKESMKKERNEEQRGYMDQILLQSDSSVRKEAYDKLTLSSREPEVNC